MAECDTPPKTQYHQGGYLTCHLTSITISMQNVGARPKLRHPLSLRALPLGSLSQKIPVAAKIDFA